MPWSVVIWWTAGPPRCSGATIVRSPTAMWRVSPASIQGCNRYCPTWRGENPVPPQVIRWAAATVPSSARAMVVVLAHLLHQHPVAQPVELGEVLSTGGPLLDSVPILGHAALPRAAGETVQGRPVVAPSAVRVASRPAPSRTPGHRRRA